MSRSFLQTKDWAQFQQAFGRKIFWIDDKLVVKFDLPLGKSWLYAPRVELKAKNEKIKIKEIELFYRELSKLAEKENAIFCKLEPNLNSKFKFEIFNHHVLRDQIQNSNVLNINNLNIDLKLKIKNLKLFASKCLQPQDELVLDITSSEEKILAQMHPKTRYNIRLAEKKGLKIVESINPKDITHFYNLAVQTSQRNNFRYHPKLYYEKMLEVFGKSKDLKAELLTAFHENEPIASLILLIYKDAAHYLHGASSNKHHNLMGTFLLQWQAIRRVKKLKCQTYNLGGIAPLIQNSNYLKIKNLKFEFDQAHPWFGITRFKLGFAPFENPANRALHYPDAYDIVYQLGMYRIYKLIKKFK